jgi:hypothetical protein
LRAEPLTASAALSAHSESFLEMLKLSIEEKMNIFAEVHVVYPKHQDHWIFHDLL